MRPLVKASIDHLDDLDSPWLNLKGCYPSLDLDYMADRSHGELHVDIAFSFTPRHDDHLVGLWRLDVLEASFGAGGYTMGSLHTIASLSRYGAIQAPMTRERSQLTDLMQNLRRMQADIETSETSERKRLELRVQASESQMSVFSIS